MWLLIVYHRHLHTPKNKECYTREVHSILYFR